MGKTDKLKVMSFNVQWFTGVNSQTAVMLKIIRKYNAGVIGLQELTASGRINKVGRTVLADYPHQYMSKHKNFMGLASAVPLKNVRCHEFSSQDPLDMERYGETRAYMTAELEIGEKTVTLINTHLCYLTPEIKYKQMRQIFRRAEKSEYVVVMGDFNTFDGEAGTMYQQFIDAGYHLANCDGKITKTWTEKPNPKWLSRLTYATDNIITSGNITIKKVYFDRIKLKNPTGAPMDHVPVIARLQIN